MTIWRSIRFRLSVQYSAVVFGLGGALLGLLYLAIRRMLHAQTMTQYVVRGEPVVVDGVQVDVMPRLEAWEWRTLESLFNELVLNQLARYTILSLIVLFLLSLVVGWVMSGRVLRPVQEITEVASDIQATDLSRRIGLQGPEDEFTRLAATFDGMLERLDRAFSSQRRFLADTSHDLRTPLAVIRANVDVVADDDEATIEDWKEVGGVIQRNVEKMSEMIEGLLATARLQIGKAEAVTVDLAHLVTAKAAEFESVAGEVGVSLESTVGSAVVEGVEVSLDRAFSNLIDNAIEVSKPGNVIRLGAGLVSTWAWMGVGDQGPGLPDSPEGGRIGLGLSIVTQIAEAHGGSLASHPGRDGVGTTMIIWLPTVTTVGAHPDTSPLSSL
ncbi:MAG TPA: HAMP domain-containing sensor histidine kinase [Acidimicrobiia bacterium]|nr:HAMP domain-containing sensor histidine kinase [Acidimicrobiia bacterium]